MSASANNNNGYANNNSAGGNSNINQGTPTAKEKAKFQNFEGQARLLAALVASLEDKGVKLDYLRKLNTPPYFQAPHLRDGKFALAPHLRDGNVSPASHLRAGEIQPAQHPRSTS